MANFSRTLTVRLTDGANTLERQQVVESDGESKVNVAVPALSTAKTFNINIDVTALKLLYITSSIPCVIEWGEGNDPMQLDPNGPPTIWTPESNYDCPLAVDVTGGSIETESASAGEVVIRVMQDATP